jgi:molybdate transport system substrate-binding protein
MHTKKSVYAGVVVLLMLLTVLVAGCTSSPTASPTVTATPTAVPQNVTLTVFAAASLSGAFNETIADYEALHPNVNIMPTYAGTQVLVTQVQNGAPGDVFASASTSYMNTLVKGGYMVNSSVANFTENKLALIVPTNNPANISGLSDLNKSGVKIVICAPSVPCGSYTLQVLNKTANNSAYGPAFKTGVMANVVSQETDVNSAVSKIALGEADVAFVYQSDVPASMQGQVKVITLPDNVNVLAVYPIGVLSQSKNQAVAQDFENYVLSANGTAILDKYHFIRLNA